MRNELLVRSNLHTHTSFCDGKDTAEEVVLSALGEGMDVLGFSEHCCTGIADVYGMKAENVPLYRAEVKRLQALYGDRIHILLGVEQDLYAGAPQEDYDYVIGSVHYVCMDGEYCPVDASLESMMRIVNEHCGGDVLRYAKAYYENAARVAQTTNCDIVGHFDLLTKFNEQAAVIDEGDPRYVAYALEALDALLERDVIFEVNTGAISRGYRKTPYPSPFLLRRIAQKGGRVVLNADAHAKEHLLYAFDKATELLRVCGFGSVMMMTPFGWKSRAL